MTSPSIDNFLIEMECILNYGQLSGHCGTLKRGCHQIPGLAYEISTLQDSFCFAIEAFKIISHVSNKMTLPFLVVVKYFESVILKSL